MSMQSRYIFGRWEANSKPLDAEDALEICREAKKVREIYGSYPLEKVFLLLDVLKEKWKRSDYQGRVEAFERLPAETGFSPAMIKIGLDFLEHLLDSTQLKRKLEVELRGIPRQFHFHFDPQTVTLKQWQPLGTMLHVLAGNVFLGGVGSLLEGLITGNVSILKMASHEKVFMPLFIKSIQECDRDGIVAKSISLVEYSSHQTEVIAAFKSEVDGIVVWGGEESVRAYRDQLPARTKLIVFGPKLSLAWVTKSGLKSQSAKALGKQLANELSIWDQNACTAPQICYVEGEENADTLIDELAKALEEKQKELPIGEVDLQAAVEIRKIRTLEECAEFRGSGRLRASKGGMQWTVWKGRDLTLESSPLHRSLSIVPYSQEHEVLEEIAKFRGYVQTVGLEAVDSQYWDIQRKLMNFGVVRILPLGQMSGGYVDDPHDGAYDLPQYLNLVFTRTPGTLPQIDPIDLIPESHRLDIINQRLRELLSEAAKSEYYSKYDNLRKIDNIGDLVMIPILTGEQMAASMPPGSTALQTTKDWHGGYVSRSGGSTGEPKFSIYDEHDWKAMIQNAARVFRALGMQKDDRLANCMLAGDLYGGFISFDHVNTLVGVTTFAIGHALSPELFYKLWKNFNINAIQGVPAAVVPVLRTIKKEHSEFTLEKVIYAGQPMSKADCDWLNQTLGVKRVASVVGANDGGQIAYQCEKMSGAMHHIVDDFNYIEIVDQEDNPVPAGMEGRIIITSLLKKAFPLIRYDIGDWGRIVPGLCSCGRTSRVLEFMGRSGDDMSLGLLNIKVSDFEAALDSIPFTALQLIGVGGDKGEILQVNVEIDSAEKDIGEKIHNLLVTKMEKLKHRLHEGTLAKLEVKIFEPGTLPRNARTGKVKKVIDQRNRGQT
ncbi:MAG: acyl-CoA reductase [Oligoflexales bacterium]